MNKPVKILYVNGGILDMGGISSYMMNYYRHFDKSKIHIDFLTQGSGQNMFVDEINSYGGNVYQIPNKGANPIKNATMLYRIIKNGKYDIVHAHADAGNAFILHIAKKAGVKIRISHSHNTDFLTKSKIKRLLNNFQKCLIKKNATELWGCSKQACEWLYSENADFTIINNAVDLSLFRFNNEIRSSVRKELNIADDCIALCQIGHLCHIKNQEFSIHVIEKIITAYLQKNVKLFLIGDGDDKEKLLNILKTGPAKNNVIFLGLRKDVYNILQGMDVMLMPSLFEGFPVTLVEGQALGLYSVISENITPEVKIYKNLIKSLPIKDTTIDDWARACLDIPNINKEQAAEVISKAGFDIEKEALALQNRYIKLLHGEEK